MRRRRRARACPRTRSPATCSARSWRGAGRRTSSCATGPGSTSTSARTPSTRRPSATTSASSSRTTAAGSGSSRAWWPTRSSASGTRGCPGRIHLFKNNTDSAGNSYGCHENYLVRRQGDFGRLSDVLVPFLLTRQVLTGAGKVLTTPRGTRYCLSQRADHIWEAVSSATTRSRPIINTRDEPHADAEHYRRLHVIVGDSSMSETTTMLKVGATDLILRMVEAGVQLRDLALENPIRAIREISHDMTGMAPVQLANGRTATAVDIQEEYLARVKEFVESHVDATPEVKQVVDLWERGLRALRTGDLLARGPRARLGHQVEDPAAVHGQARPAAVGRPRSPGSTSPTTTSRAPRGCTTCSRRAAWSSGSRPTSRCSRPRRCRRRRRGPSCAATSCGRPRRPAATTRWTGCTSSSTTRPSAPCCARTRSAASTSGWSGSSSRM